MDNLREDFKLRAGGETCAYCLYPYADHDSYDQIWEHAKQHSKVLRESMEKERGKTLLAVGRRLGRGPGTYWRMR
jgi:hypothetical protein